MRNLWRVVPFVLCCAALTQAQTSYQATLTWTDTSADESGFRVERSAGDGASAWAEVGQVPANVATYVDGQVAAGESYCWRVLAWNAAGASVPSAPACGDVPGGGPGPPPSAPTTLQLHIGEVPAPAPAPTSELLATLQKFAETAARNWNFEGHSVDAQFGVNQGLWDYTDTTYEPWLFDRPEVWRMLHEMTGNPRWKTQADSDLAYYESRLSAAGFFMNKTGEQDTKYSYVHTWGDAAKAAAAYTATAAGFPSVVNIATIVMWTERELAIALDAAVKYHTMSNDPGALARAKAIVTQWDTVRGSNGAPLPTYTQHEGGGPGGTIPTDPVSSPWMSATYFQAARLYALRFPADAPIIHKQASDYFDWLNVPANRGFYPGTDAHPQYVGFVFPAYLAGGTLIGDAGPGVGDMDHALDVAGFVSFALKAKAALGLPTTAAAARLAEMKVTAARSFTEWTRPTLFLPKYRLAPPRKFNWWTRGLYELKANGGLG